MSASPRRGRCCTMRRAQSVSMRCSRWRWNWAGANRRSARSNDARRDDEAGGLQDSGRGCVRWARCLRWKSRAWRVRIWTGTGCWSCARHGSGQGSVAAWHGMPAPRSEDGATPARSRPVCGLISSIDQDPVYSKTVVCIHRHGNLRAVCDLSVISLGSKTVRLSATGISL